MAMRWRQLRPGHYLATSPTRTFEAGKCKPENRPPLWVLVVREWPGYERQLGALYDMSWLGDFATLRECREMAERHLAATESLDIVYRPHWYFGVLFAERTLAKRVAQTVRAVNESTTWGQFRKALPAEDWAELVEQGDDIPPDDTPFSAAAFGWSDDGLYTGPWPPGESLKWFPKELIEKYGGKVEGGPWYDNLFLPPEAADAIADELRARGHRVEKTLTGDLFDWGRYVYGTAERTPRLRAVEDDE